MKILVIEDTEKLAASIQKGLEQKGHVCDVVHDGDEGEKRIFLYHDDYDAIILDLMLPTRNGFEICKAVRDRGITTPILILSARDATEDTVSLLNLGADDYLTKPFSMDELEARLKSIARRPESVPTTEVKVGKLKLNTITHEVWVGKEKLELSLKEYALLEYFMKNPGVAHSRDTLYSKMWDFNSNTLSNTVDVHITHLRKKLKKYGLAEYIATVRGVGYRFSA
jgi:DNA-binding response OmpR family regulator